MKKLLMFMFAVAILVFGGCEKKETVETNTTEVNTTVDTNVSDVNSTTEENTTK